PREGTAAAAFTDRVHPAVTAERRERLRELERELAVEYARGLLGMELDMMVEGDDSQRPGNVIGTSCRFLPVSIPRSQPVSPPKPGEDVIVGRCIRVRAMAWANDVIIGAANTSLPAKVSFEKIALPLAPFPIAC